MEPTANSKLQEGIDNLVPPDFHNHRSRMSTSADQTLLVAADSGYGSTYNVTPYNTSDLSSNLSSISTPHRINNNNNSNLITITEIPDSTTLTPITQNIRKITDFHITTPKSNDFPLVGTKRHLIAALNFEDYQSTPKKAKIQHESTTTTIVGDSDVKSLEHTPRRLKRPRSQKKLFRQKLRSAPDFGAQLEAESVDIENICSSYQRDFSPIQSSKTHAREKRTPLSNANANSMQASTPKSCGYRPKATAINFTEKSPSVKKLLSFSDQQFEDLMKSGLKSEISQTLMKSNGKPTVEDSETPVKQIRLTSIDRSSDTSSSDDCKTIDIYQEQSFREYKRVYPVLNSVFNDREFAKRRAIESRLELKTRSRSMSPPLNSGLAEIIIFQNSKKPSITATVTSFEQILEVVPTCGDMEISPLKKSTFQSPPTEFEWIYESENNYNLKTPSDIVLNQTIQLDSVHQTTALKQKSSSLEKANVKTPQNEPLERLPRTPKKHKLCSVDQERLDIIYPSIPHTPSKKPYVSTQTELKRKQPERRPRKFFYGITHLNIISKLEPYTLVLDKIFQLLSSQDLLNLTRVSKSWKRIIRSNDKASTRLKKYLEEWRLSKENNGKNKVYEQLELKTVEMLVDGKKNERLIRVPFSQTNKNDRKRCLGVQNSPPVSPSKRKFHENQKVVRTLAENEKLTKCPRCAKSSRIINTPPVQDQNENHHNRDSTYVCSTNNGRTFSKYFQTFQATTSTYYSLSNDNNNFDVSLSQPGYNITPQMARSRGKLIKSMSCDSGLTQEQTFQQQQRRRLSSPFRPFAECSGLGCRFRFCLDCLCEYHPGVRCKLTEPISPSKEDLQNGILQVNSVSASRSLKTRRKSLKRLCF